MLPRNFLMKQPSVYSDILTKTVVASPRRTEAEGHDPCDRYGRSGRRGEGVTTPDSSLHLGGNCWIESLTNCVAFCACRMRGVRQVEAVLARSTRLRR